MSWWTHMPALAAAVAVLYAPGIVAALIVRLRGFTALAAAVPLSAAMLTAASLLNVVAPFRWDLISWLISAAGLVVIALAIRVRVGRGADAEHRPSVSAWRSALPFLVLGVVCAVGAARLTLAIGRADDISQTFDNIYHLNSARLILDGGLIAPTRQMLPGFYPDLWHIIVATTSVLSGASIPIAVNAVSLVLGALVWPAACIWLTRTIVGGRTDATVAAGAISTGLAAFPMLMLDFGVLYPNVLSISLLPSAVAVLVLISALGAGPRPGPTVRWALLIAVVPALALAHPSTLMAWLMFSCWIVVIAFPRWFRRTKASGATAAHRRIATGAVIAALTIGALLFVAARPSRELAFWPPSATVPAALQQLLTGGLVWRPQTLSVVAIVAAGVVTVLAVRVWRAHWWLVAALLSLSFLYIVCIAAPQGTFRYALTGTWYQDVYRIAALFPTVLVPLGAFGVIGVSTLCRALLQTERRGRLVAVVPGAVGVATGVLLLALTQTGPALATETSNTQKMYRQDATSPLITDDERTLIERLPEHVPASDVIVGNPWTGTSLSYALVKRKALVPHIFQELTPDMRLITDKLDQADRDPAVCEALERTHTRWVLDFGTREIHNGDHSYSGLKNLSSEVVQLVDQQGSARLYRIVACR